MPYKPKIYEKRAKKQNEKYQTILVKIGTKTPSFKISSLRLEIS
jgi:hypothetical protein